MTVFLPLWLVWVLKVLLITAGVVAFTFLCLMAWVGLVFVQGFKGGYR